MRHDDDIFVTLTLFPPQAQAHRSHEARRPQHTPTPHTAPRGYTTTEGGAQVTFSIQHGIKVSRAFGDLGPLKIDNRDLREYFRCVPRLRRVRRSSAGPRHTRDMPRYYTNSLGFAAVSKWILLALVVVLARLLARLICTCQIAIVDIVAELYPPKSIHHPTFTTPPAHPAHPVIPSPLPSYTYGYYLRYIRAASAVEKATRSISTIRDSSKRRAKRCLWP